MPASTNDQEHDGRMFAAKHPIYRIGNADAAPEPIDFQSKRDILRERLLARGWSGKSVYEILEIVSKVLSGELGPMGDIEP